MIKLDNYTVKHHDKNLSQNELKDEMKYINEIFRWWESVKIVAEVTEPTVFTAGIADKHWYTITNAISAETAQEIDSKIINDLIGLTGTVTDPYR